MIGTAAMAFNTADQTSALIGLKLRLTRVRSPITVKGTLAHPAVGIDAGKLADT